MYFLRLVKYFQHIFHIVANDLQFLIDELEAMAEWFVRDWEDILFPWYIFISRTLLDTYLYPYTLCASQFISLLGDSLFRITDILITAKRNVENWIENFTQKPFKFAFVSKISRNVRNWFELLQRLILQNILEVIGILLIFFIENFLENFKKKLRFPVFLENYIFYLHATKVSAKHVAFYIT